jgi:hypothetical protein
MQNTVLSYGVNSAGFDIWVGQRQLFWAEAGFMCYFPAVEDLRQGKCRGG